MGFPGHSKIAGHSGTEFKHRKAFSKIKHYHQQSSVKNNVPGTEEFLLPIPATVPTNYLQAYQKERSIKLLINLPVFLIAISLVGYLLINFSNECEKSFVQNYERGLSNLEKNKEEKIRRIKNFTYFYNSGNYHLQKNELLKAQKKFTRALALDEYNIDARIGLTETLIAQCQQYHLFCKEAQIQLDFLDDTDYLMKEGIWELDDKLRSANWK